MKRIIFLIVMAISLLIAKDTQLYFIGKYARVASISKDDTQSKAIYLKWGMVDGNFPSEIDKVVLKRDGIKIFEFNPHSKMTKKEIKGLYKSKLQKRRLLETINNISKLDKEGCGGANLSNYATKILQCSNDPFWRYLASMNDFNIARINYRGFLDRSIDNKNSFDYELIATKGAKTIVLGRITVKKELKQIQKAKNFKQVLKNSCNSLEYALDDYTIYLGWQGVGENEMDKFLNSFTIVGYDIFRTKENVIDKQNQKYDIDISSLASSLPYDSSGDIIFQNLQKVNETLITIPNNDENSTLFLETKDKLKRAGLKPDDERYYYLVARDFTGNYSKTARVLVKVPNLLPPPAPWNIRVVEDINFTGEKNSAELFWDNVNLNNYINYYKNSKKFCNKNNLNKKDRLRFVDNDGVCGISEMEVNLNLSKYNIYRFDSPKEASNFQYDNCKHTKNSHLIATIPANKDLITYKDESIQLGKIYWYIVISISENNITSPLSAPIRAMIPDRKLPPKTKAKLFTCDDKISLQKIPDNRFIDVSGEAKSARLLCGDKTYFGTLDEIYEKKSQCNESGNLSILGTNGKILAKIDFSNDDTTQGYLIEYICEKREVEYGNILTKWPTIIFSDNREKCIEISQNYGGERYKVKKECGVEEKLEIKKYNFANLGNGEKFCLAVNEFSKNNQYSPTQYLPCFGVVDKKIPNKPNISSLILNSKSVEVEWLPPQENISATLIELYKKGDSNQTYTKFYPHLGHLASDGYLKVLIDVDKKIEKNQIWCARGKTIGLNKKVSPWSAIKCLSTKAKENYPYLSWPSIKKAKPKKSLEIKYTNNRPEIKLGKFITDKCSVESECDCEVLKNLFANIANFSLYRQDIYPNERGDFVQVSPLIDELKCGINQNYNTSAIFENIKIKIANSSNKNTIVEFFYIDNYPHIKNSSYSYEFVFFDPISHEPNGYSLTKPKIFIAK